jgi:hypothetical protein
VRLRTVTAAAEERQLVPSVPKFFGATKDAAARGKERPKPTLMLRCCGCS